MVIIEYVIRGRLTADDPEDLESTGACLTEGLDRLREYGSAELEILKNGSDKPEKKPRKRTPKVMKPFVTPVIASASLAEIVGSKPMPRTEIVKRLWAYIKKNGLQDAKKRTMINADSALKAIFGGRTQVSMFEMTNLISKHLKEEK